MDVVCVHGAFLQYLPGISSYSYRPETFMSFLETGTNAFLNAV